MTPISFVRFNAVAGYARRPMTGVTAEELAWYEHDQGRILGLILRDRADGDFGHLVFAPDQRRRYRNVHVGFEADRRRAEVALRRALEAAAMAPVEDHHQGDEVGGPVDFFALSRPRERLHPSFVVLMESPGYAPARRMIEPMMRWFDDVDGNFIEQFQTTGFDQRIWELYLFAAFIEMGYELDRRHAVPDFSLVGLRGAFSVEAVTVGASPTEKLAPPVRDTVEGMRTYLQDYMPIKFGSALYSKLRKRYWERENVAGRPLVFAIEDFSSPGSMVETRVALDIYLYGYDHNWTRDAEGRLVITPRRIETHRWGKKVIPSGYFRQPDAENISAVLFSNSGTIAKFNRMGVLAGFGDPDLLVMREGLIVNHNPNATEAIPFRHVVNDPRYSENWGEGLDVFHNPNALHPLDPGLLPGAAHHFLLENGLRESRTPDWHPLTSVTRMLGGVDVEALLSRQEAQAEIETGRGGSYPT
ncbi:MAG: hypothetical protein IE910_00155 [Brevundimonas sp.]|nr:hypothetical protein [Brevundimonas sp.]